MQLPGPTLIVTQGQLVRVTLTNNLPKAAGNTSILFPGFTVTASGGTPGVLTQEATVGGTVTYSFLANKPGTYAYYSGTQGDLQVEMGLYGALIVLPDPVPSVCSATQNDAARAADRGNGVHKDFRLATAAYNHPSACYDREYLFQFSEMDPDIHHQAEAQKDVPCTKPTGCMVVATEPYVPAYFMINGRSMPDLMEPN
jgi:FtsP/CotA-like multicopper oxidase with cupredoxin domain